MRNASSNIATNQEVNDEILYNAHLLRKASKKGDVVKVKSLIEELGQKNLDLTDDSSISALMYAAQYGHDNVVRILINSGADVDLTNEGSSALFLATEKGHTEVVNSLIEAEADVNWINIFKGSALMIAVYKGNAEVVNSLIKAGADVNFIDRLGQSILLIAAFKSNAEVVNSLIKAGANFCYEALDLIDHTEMRTSIIESVALDPVIDEVKKKEIVSQLLLNGASLSQELLDSSRISDDMKIFVEGHNTPEKIEERDKNLLVNKAFQESILKKSILAGKPITFRDDIIVDTLLVEALKSITAEDLVSNKNLKKLQESGVYPLLEIIKNLSDNEISFTAKNLKDFKVISDKISLVKDYFKENQSFEEPDKFFGENLASEPVSIKKLDGYVMSIILTNSFEGYTVFDKDLTSKFVENLFGMPSNDALKKQEVNQLHLYPLQLQLLYPLQLQLLYPLQLLQF